MDNDNGLEGEFILGTTPQKATSPISASLHTPPTAFSTVNPLSSFKMYPKGLSFVNQESDEFIIMLLRRHFITNLPWIATIVGLLFVPLISALLLAPVFSSFSLSQSTLISILLFYYIALFGYAILKYTLWYFHLGLVTNVKIVDVDMTSILSKNVAETIIEAIEDASYTQKGFLRTFFDYGDVIVQTEATDVNFEFDNTPHPSRVVQIINGLAAEASKKIHAHKV